MTAKGDGSYALAFVFDDDFVNVFTAVYLYVIKQLFHGSGFGA